MDQKLLNDLAIAYAQTRLLRKQSDSTNPPSRDELYSFIYDYRFALGNIEEQMRQYPTI